MAGDAFEAELRANIDWSSAEATTQAFLQNFEAALKRIGVVASAGPEGSVVAGGLLRELETASKAFRDQFKDLFASASFPVAKFLEPLRAQLENFGFSGPSSQKFGFGGASKDELRLGYGTVSPPSPTEVQNQLAAQIEARAADGAYAKAKVRVTAALINEEASIDEAKAGSQAYLDATTRAATARLQLSALEDDNKAGSQAYLNATVLAKTNRALLAAIENENLAVSSDYVTATVLAATALKRRATAETEAEALDQDLLQATVAEITAINERTAYQDALKATDQDYLTSVELSTEANNLRVAAEKEALAGSESYLLSVERLAAASLALETAELDATAAVRAQAEAAKLAAGGAAASGASGASAAVSGGALGGIGAILPLVAGFTAYSQLRAALKDAEDLDKILAVTRVQLNDLGRGAQFDAFKAGIQGIATETGALNKDVGQVALQFQAAFGGDTVAALNETDDAMKAMRVTGLSASQAINDFIAINKNFDTTVAQVTDTALGLQQRFGQTAQSSIEFASQLASVGKEAGFTAKDLEAIGAAYNEFSGKPGTAGSEQIGRVLSGIQGKAVALIQFLQTNAPDIAQSVANSLASGDIREAFKILLANYDSLTAAQQQQLLVTIAGRREASAVAAVFGNTGKLLDELNGKYDDSGKLQHQFAETQKTIIQQLAEIGAAFKKVGLDFFDAGLKDVLVGLATELGAVLEGIDKLVNAVGLLNDASHGLLSTLALIVGTLKIIELLANSNLLAKVLGGSIGGQAIGKGAANLTEVTAVGAGLSRLNPLSAIAPAAAAYSGEIASGAGVATALSSGASAAVAAAGPGLIILGGFMADKIIGSFSDGVQGTIDKRLSRDLGGKSTVDTLADADSILKRGQVPGITNTNDLSKFLASAPNLAGAKPTDLLSSAIHDQAGIYDKLLDSGPGPFRSLGIDEIQARKKAALDALGANVKSNLSNLQTNAEVLQQFLNGLNDDQKTGLFGSDSSPDSARNQIEGLIQRLDAKKGDVQALSGDDQRLLGRFGVYGPQLKAAASTVATNLKKLDDQATQQQNDIQDAASAKKAFEDGEIGLAEYLDNLKSGQAALDAFAASGTNLQASKDAIKNRALFAQATSDALLREVEAFKNAATISGTDTPTADAGRLTELLNRNDFTNETDKLKATKELVDALKAEKTYEASLTNDAIQKAAILNSVSAVPANAKEALISEFLQSSLAFQTYLHNTLAGQSEAQKSITTIVATELANGETDVRAAFGKATAFQISVLQQELDQLLAISGTGENNTRIAQLQSQIKGLTAASPQTTPLDPTETEDSKKWKLAVLQNELNQLLSLSVYLIDQNRVNQIRAQIKSLTAEQPIINTLDPKDFENSRKWKLAVLQNELNQILALSVYIVNQARVKQLQDEIAGLTTAVPPPTPIVIPDFSTVGADPQSKLAADQAADTQRKADENARLDVLAAQANGDAIQLAVIAQQRAQIDEDFAKTAADHYKAQAAMITADQQLAKAQVAYADSLRKVANAQSGNDAVVVANNAVGSALGALQLLQPGTEAYNTALAAYVDAVHGFARSLLASETVQANLAEALLIAGGDPVGAAKVKLEDLQRQLANAGAAGLSVDDQKALMGQIIAQGDAVTQAVISQGEQHIQTQLTLMKITKGQAIHQLQALRAEAVLMHANQNELDAIDVQIKQLTDSLGQDFKFNLPTVLGLPSLYEARRVNQSGAEGNGIGYQDNRVVTVTISAQTNATPQQIATAVSGVLGAPQASSTYSRRYGG